MGRAGLPSTARDHPEAAARHDEERLGVVGRGHGLIPTGSVVVGMVAANAQVQVDAVAEPLDLVDLSLPVFLAFPRGCLGVVDCCVESFLE